MGNSLSVKSDDELPISQMYPNVKQASVWSSADHLQELIKCLLSISPGDETFISESMLHKLPMQSSGQISPGSRIVKPLCRCSLWINSMSCFIFSAKPLLLLLLLLPTPQLLFVHIRHDAAAPAALIPFELFCHQFFWKKIKCISVVYYPHSEMRTWFQDI